MRRYGMSIKVKPGKIEEYKRLHSTVWPDVLKMISDCNIRNYSIYLKYADLSENPKNTGFFWTFFKSVPPPLQLS